MTISAAVRTAGSEDEAALIGTIVLAFSTDPMARWAWPGATEYMSVMSALTRAFGGNAFAHDSAFCTDDCAGAALWLPPGVLPDEETMIALVERTLEENPRGDTFSVFEQMAQFHPSEPHWYLPLIGVDPSLQGQGYGSALLQHVTSRFDREGAVAYLESSNPRNIPLYERHGFVQVGRIQAGSSPAMVPMVRQPRGGARN